MLLLIVWLAGCGTPDDGPTRRVSAPVRHADLVSDLDAKIAEARRLSDEHRDWTRLERLADLYEQHARLVGGNFDDYARAQETLDRAFAIAPEGSGPWLAQASLDFTLHRLDRVEPSLAMYERRVLVDENARGTLARMRADVAFQRGDFTSAEELYREAERHRRTIGTCYGLVQLAWWKGKLDEAQAGLDGCETLVQGRDPQTHAWFDVQRGLVEVDRRDYRAAESHYLDATNHVAGWFLVDKSLADARSNMGKTSEAEAAYRDLIARNEAPDSMDALATLLIASGREAEGHAWAQRADVVWRRELARFPEATYAHALDHFLLLGNDPDETMALALDNVRVRPNGPARVKLARELLAAGDRADAQAEVDSLRLTPYRSADLDALEAELSLSGSANGQ